MIKTKDLSGHERKKKWMTMKCPLLRKRSQSEKAINCTIVILRHSGKDKTTKMVNKSLVVRCLGMLIR